MIGIPLKSMLQADFNCTKWLYLSLILLLNHNIYGQRLVQATSATLKDENGYKLRTDEITVNVVNEPDCTINQTVPNDGLIRLPHIGEFMAANFSTKKLECKLNKNIF